MPVPAYPDADELLDALAAVDATLDGVRREAGRGLHPESMRRLQSHVRSLRQLAGEDAAQLALDVTDAASRVLDSADPAPPLLVLGFAQRALSRLLHRLARQAHPQAA